MSVAYVRIFNKSGRSIDALSLYHSSGQPDDLSQMDKVFDTKNLANGASFPANDSKQIQTSSGSPTDYWVGGIRFEGDGETYIISGLTGSPFKEFAIGNNNGFDITVNAYQTDSANQSDLSLEELNGGETNTGTAFLLNSTTSKWINAVKIVAEIAAELADIPVGAAETPEEVA